MNNCREIVLSATQACHCKHNVSFVRPSPLVIQPYFDRRSEHKVIDINFDAQQSILRAQRDV